MKVVFQLCFFLLSLPLLAQNGGTIKGQITDQGMHNEPMMMASVAIKGSDTRVESNLHGNFEINDISPGNYTLTISFSGYDSKEIPVTVQSDKTSQIEAALMPKTLDVDMAALLSERTNATKTASSAETQKFLK